MKYIIDYEEVVQKINSITIEVKDESEGDEIADKLEDKARNFNHPDDIFDALQDMGVKVVDTCEGAEDFEYEIL